LFEIRIEGGGSRNITKAEAYGSRENGWWTVNLAPITRISSPLTQVELPAKTEAVSGPFEIAASCSLQHHAALMKSPRPVPRHPVSEETVERVTVSLAQSDKTKLERIAEKKRVSLAWVVRDAITEYLERQPGQK
jgi:hypothetical protein